MKARREESARRRNEALRSGGVQRAARGAGRASDDEMGNLGSPCKVAEPRLLARLGNPNAKRLWRRKEGQLTVELMLILPVFLLMVFTIMELGHLAFWTIVVNHMAYEGARIGSMWAGATQWPSAEQFDTARAQQHVQDQLKNALPTAVVGVALAPESYVDAQDGQVDRDLIVTVRQPVHLVFPMTPWVLRISPSCRDTPGVCYISASVRMPIENPRRFSG